MLCDADLPDLKAADIGGTANRLTYEDLVRQHIVSASTKACPAVSAFC